MPTAYTTLTITDGTTTCDLVDGTNYALSMSGWAPSVAPRRRSVLGGLRYEDVTEEITLNVFGTTTAIALQNLATLNYLLDQAERWYAGEKVIAVTVRYQPQGSLLAAPLRALVLGRDDTSGMIGLPMTFNDLLMVYEISGVRLRFLRRGQWTEEAEVAAGSATTHSMPVYGDRAFGVTHLPSSPLNVRLGGFTATTTPIISPGLLIVSTNLDRSYLLTSDSATASEFTSVADAGSNPAGTGVLRYTPTTNGPMTSGAIAIGAGFSAEARVVGVIATIRANSSLPNWTISATLSGAGVTMNTPDMLIPAGVATTPKVYFLGTVVSERSAWTSLVLNVTADGSLAGPASLDVDVVMLVALDDEYTRILALDAMTLTGAFASGATAVELTVSARADANRTPFVGLYAPVTGEFVYASYRGDARLAISGTTVYVRWLACGGTNVNSWRFTNASNAVVAGQAVDITRYKAYLSAQ